MHVWTHSNNLSNYHTWVISLPLVRYKTTRSLQHKTNYTTSLFCSLGISIQLLILFNCAISDSLVKQLVSSSIFTFVTLALAATSSKGLAWFDVHWCFVDTLSAALWSMQLGLHQCGTWGTWCTCNRTCWCFRTLTKTITYF